MAPQGPGSLASRSMRTFHHPIGLVVLLVLSAPVAADDLANARAACERDFAACARVTELEAVEREAQDRQAEERYAQEQAARAARLAQEQAEADALEREQAERKKKCGKDYQRVRRGMKWSRVQACAGPFTMVSEDALGAVYKADGGWVRVHRGRVVRWTSR